MTASPIYVEPFLGAGATWLRLLDARLVPPVSWMGGKRRMAGEILAMLDLRPGQPIPAILGDASWWGWVWPTLLDAETGPRVSEALRSWRGEDPRALWFRLRDAGPFEDVAEAAAQILWLQARAASGVPVWWEGGAAVMDRGWKSPTCSTRGMWRAKQGHADEPTSRWALHAAGGGAAPPGVAYDRGANGRRSLVSMDGHGRGPCPAWQATGLPAGTLVQWASTKVDGAGQRNTRLLAEDGRGEPRESGQRTTRNERLVANTRGGQVPGTPFEAGHKGIVGAGGIVDTATVADRVDAVRAACAKGTNRAGAGGIVDTGASRLVKGSGGPAAPGKQNGWCAARGWRSLQPGDVADRVDAIGRAAPLVTIHHTDARWLTEIYAEQLGDRARVVLDPPYQGATGYPATCPREEVLLIAETWARHGARVVLHEAVGLAADLGPGWTQAQLRVGRKPEWVTVHGCDVRDALPALLREIAKGAVA